MTEGQRRALAELWEAFGLDVDRGLVKPLDVFGNEYPLVVEIGFGMGDSLFDMAHANPDENFIGIEVHRPGVGHLLRRADEAGIGNLRVFNADSVEVLRRCFDVASIDRLQIFFPDPWHKKRHHKRRLVNPRFAAMAQEKLKPGGILHIATDWPPYAEDIEAVLAEVPGMARVEAPSRTQTKYERRGLKLGHKVADLAWCRQGS